MNTCKAFCRRHVGRKLIVGLLTLSSPLSGFAALGDSSSSVLMDQAKMKASLATTEESAYSIHEMKSSTGTVVREYVSPNDGRVFAVGWQGPFIPDLKLLLGAYFREYSRAAEAQRESHVGRHPLNIQTPGLVVQTIGHMGDFSGRAYVPGLVPTGVDANVIH